MKIKYLFQALKFACLPTLSILVLLFCGFFSISKTIDFISSDSGWAIFLRIFLVIAEMALVVIMYINYADEGQKKEEAKKRDDIIKDNKATAGKIISYSKDVYEIGEGWSYNDIFTQFSTLNPDIVIIERTPKSK